MIVTDHAVGRSGNGREDLALCTDVSSDDHGDARLLTSLNSSLLNSKRLSRDISLLAIPIENSHEIPLLSSTYLLALNA